MDHVWLIDERKAELLLTPPRVAVDDVHRIYYVDLYSNGGLMLYIPATDAYSARKAHRYFALDSSMFNGFKRYVIDAERSTVRVVGMEQLLDYAVAHGYSVLPTAVSSGNR